MVRVHFGPPLFKHVRKEVKTGTIEFTRQAKPKWTRKAALGNSPVDCCNRRGFPAGKRVLGPPLQTREWIWGFSSAGRAPALQAGGQRFDPANLHHFFKELTEIPLEDEISLSLLSDSRCTLKTEHCDYDAIMRRQQ